MKTTRAKLQRLRVPLGFVTAIVFLLFAHPSRLSLLAGFPIALCGVAIRAWAAGHLKKNAELAVSGPYSYTRNPLYFGSYILASGCAVGGGNWWSGLLLIGFFFAVYLPVMQAEAEHMMTLFAQAYPAYAQHVPLFLPRLTPWQPATQQSPHSLAFDHSLYLRYREYRALIGLVIVFAVLSLKAVF